MQQAHKPFTHVPPRRYIHPREEALLSHVEEGSHRGKGLANAFAERQARAAARRIPCEVCGQAFSQTWFLKAHMKKHRGSFDPSCHICGRRFRSRGSEKPHRAHDEEGGEQKQAPERAGARGHHQRRGARRRGDRGGLSLYRSLH